MRTLESYSSRNSVKLSSRLKPTGEIGDTVFVVVPLYSKEGKHVANVRVLPYNDKHMPEAILWGERLFVKREDKKYYEGFCHVVNEMPARRKDDPDPDRNGGKPGDETKRLR